MKLPEQEIKKIAIFRALQLGDMLCAIPAIRALHHHFPKAEITLLGLPWARSLLDRFPSYLNRFIHFTGYPGLPEQEVDPRSFYQFLGKLLEERFDLILQMQGNGSIVNPMVELLGGKYTAGFYLKDDYAPNKELFLEYPTGIHEIERHLRLMQYLGISATNTDLEFPLYKIDEEELNSLKLHIHAGKYVCIHPGSRGAWRQWPTAHFATLADRCAEEGFTVVLTGTKDELSIIDQVVQKMNHEAVIAAGRTSIGAVGVLIRDAFALISNCTGVSHIAAALKTPSIVISMDGEPERWAPLNKQLHRTIDWTKTPDLNLAYKELDFLIREYAQGNHFRQRGAFATKHIPD